MFSYDLLLNAVTAGLLLGGFYAAVSVGISISFGMLDIVNIAHPAFIILGSYIAYIVNARSGFDPILVLVALSPLFFLLGGALPRLLPLLREARPGIAARPRLLLRHPVHHRGRAGADLRRRLPQREAAYTDADLRLGDIDFPLRLLVPFLVSVAMVVGAAALPHAHLLRPRHARGGAGPARAAADGRRPGAGSSGIAFALSIATAAIAGAFLIVIQPVEPSIGREYIGLVFAVCVLGGMGSCPAR